MKYFLLIYAPFLIAQTPVPQEWGESVTGVKTRLKTTEKRIALTFDLCGGRTDGYDRRYVDYLTQQKIPATVFVAGAWIERHPEEFKELSANPLFALENHGTRHRPCSINGQSAYGISGTESPEAIYEEVELNAQRIAAHTHKKPQFYRSGTAYYDELAVQLVQELGYEVLGFTIVGDKGATASADETEAAVSAAQPGDIIILHMNRPEKPCAEGALKGFEYLKNAGYEFVLVENEELE